MDDEKKKNIKNLAQETEVKITQSLLRWKYKREGRPVPQDKQLEKDSRLITKQANKVITRRGKNIWNE